MKRRALTAILAALCLVCGARDAAQALTSLRVTADSTVKVVGGTFWVHVRIANVQRLGGFSVRLALEQTAVQYLSGTDDAFLPTALPFGLLITPHAGASGLADSVTFDKVNLSAPASGSGSLFSVRLRALGAGTTTIRFELVKLRDAANNPLPVDSLASDPLVLNLPVRYASFTASWTSGKGVEVSWKTISEIANHAFEVQRSAYPGSGFVAVPGGSLPAAGTSYVEHDYAYTDHSVPPGIWYYRLRQIGADSSTSFSDPLQVQVLTSAGETPSPSAYALCQNYPNPFNPATRIRFTLARAGRVRLAVYDPLGRETSLLVDAVLGAGTHETVWNAGGLPSGVYLCRLTAGSFTAVRTLTLLK